MRGKEGGKDEVRMRGKDERIGKEGGKDEVRIRVRMRGWWWWWWW